MCMCVVVYSVLYMYVVQSMSAPLAQLVERRSHNPEVVSSILTGST